MSTQGLTLHETMELHEILNFKNLCLTKSQTMQGLVGDGALKNLLQKDVEQSTRAVQDLQNLLSRVQMQ